MEEAGRAPIAALEKEYDENTRRHARGYAGRKCRCC